LWSDPARGLAALGVLLESQQFSDQRLGAQCDALPCGEHDDLVGQERARPEVALLANRKSTRHAERERHGLLPVRRLRLLPELPQGWRGGSPQQPDTIGVSGSCREPAYAPGAQLDELARHTVPLVSEIPQLLGAARGIHEDIALVAQELSSDHPQLPRRLVVQSRASPSAASAPRAGVTPGALGWDRTR